jgi:hypothetical protein
VKLIGVEVLLNVVNFVGFCETILRELANRDRGSTTIYVFDPDDNALVDSLLGFPNEGFANFKKSEILVNLTGFDHLSSLNRTAVS